MKTARLELLKNLFEILNTHSFGSTNYILALYFIDNYDLISYLNIYSISEENNLSRATVRRFCQELGYDNFKELKESSSGFHDGFKIYKQYYSANSFTSEFNCAINSHFSAIDKCAQNNYYSSLVDSILNSEVTYVMCSSQVYPTIQRFQTRLLSFGIKLLVPHDNLQLLNNLTDNDHILVVSITGQYFDSLLSALGDVKNLSIVTNNTHLNPVNLNYSQTYHFGCVNCLQNSIDNYPTLLYSFGIEYLCEILTNQIAISSTKTK